MKQLRKNDMEIAAARKNTTDWVGKKRKTRWAYFFTLSLSKAYRKGLKKVYTHVPWNNLFVRP